ncbi:MAG: alpha/beta fold hydrolase [Pseudoxanthomonas sp.]
MHPLRRSALLVHGAGGGAWEWRHWLSVLQVEGWQPHALELQPAAEGVAATSLQDYVRQVSDALERMQRPRVLIGASLGGLLAVICAEQADALVLVNPLPPSPWNAALPAQEWGGSVAWQRNARLASTRQAMPDGDEASALFAFRHWRDESGAVMQQATAGVEVRRPLCPALFVVSRQDDAVPPEIISSWSREWQADLMETFATSHVGPLLGSHAHVIARQAVAWLNQLKGLR